MIASARPQAQLPDGPPCHSWFGDPSLGEIDTCHVNLVQEHVKSIYPGDWQANAAVWELFIAVDDDLREAARQEECINLY